MVREATSGLNQLGVNHIEFIPFYPGAEPVEGIGLAVTPDEERYVPDSVKQVVNIGQRCLTSETMIEAALKLGRGGTAGDDLSSRHIFQVWSPAPTILT